MEQGFERPVTTLRVGDRVYTMRANRKQTIEELLGDCPWEDAEQTAPAVDIHEPPVCPEQPTTENPEQPKSETPAGEGLDEGKPAPTGAPEVGGTEPGSPTPA